MDLPGPTDVLSFPMDELEPGKPGEPPVTGMLGDIVIAPEFATTQALEAGREPQAELDLLMVHGVLHLLGFDHEEPEEHKVMFDLQVEILTAFESTGSPS
jgi:probable rRNA maturation factor